MITAMFEYCGMPDYWTGNGRRWDDDAGCLFAYLSPDMTIGDIIKGWVDDWQMGGDCDSIPDDVGDDELRQALQDVFKPEIQLDDVFDYDWGDWTDDDLEQVESPICVVLIEYTPN